MQKHTHFFNDRYKRIFWFAVGVIAIVIIGLIIGHHYCTSTCSFNIKHQYCDGIDVSHHNNNVDWDVITANYPEIKFVYIKATEGSTGKDANYKKYLKGAHKAGLKVGAYHYLRSTSNVRDQFLNFSQTVKKSDIDIIPVVDVEERSNWSRSEFQDSLRLFINLVKKEYNVTPMIYSVNSFYNKNCAPEFNVYHLWIGRYGDKPPVIKGKGTYTLWQFSDSNHLKGTVKSIDHNIFNAKYSLKDICIR